jgi:hypothetical protein
MLRGLLLTDQCDGWQVTDPVVLYMFGNRAAVNVHNTGRSDPCCGQPSGVDPIRVVDIRVVAHILLPRPILIRFVSLSVTS